MHQAVAKALQSALFTESSDPLEDFRQAISPLCTSVSPPRNLG